MKKIVVVALDGVLDSTLALTLDTLRTAHVFAEKVTRTGGLRLVVMSRRRTIRTAGGMRLDAGLTFREQGNRPLRADWIVVPGLGLTSPKKIAPRLAESDARAAMELLRRSRAAVGASCSSVFLLAESGLLAGRTVTSTWWLAQAFRARYPGVMLDEMKMLVRDGRFLTAGSAFAQLDLVLAIVTETLGAAVADLCSRHLLIDHRPSQARYMIQSHVRHVDPTVVAAERWIDAHLAEPVAVTELAAAMALSPKTLARRIAAATGVPPLRLVQRRRLLHATHLLETTPLTVEEVAARVGYQDGTALRRIMKRELGTTPASLRR
ncbi:MAG TPA: helix-turn-helix domain-containing protein [Thermoanaerobaculia bacterium]|nr:helix-turn-helix domain-containing protein [Thermoanaerobaculia bacterium]